MFVIIINYVVRGFIVLLGILLVSGIIFPENMDDSQMQMMQLMGGIFILWGIYRLITFYYGAKKYRNNRVGDDDE